MIEWKRLKLGKYVEGIHTAGMSHNEWLSLRNLLHSNQTALGGSDIGVVMGLSKYKSNISLFWEKVGLKERTFKGNRATLRGHLMEDPIVAYLWEHHDGSDPDSVVRNHELGHKPRKCRNLNYIIRSKDHPGILANVDKHLIHTPEYHGKGVLELKTMTSRVADQYEIGFPPGYLCQIHAYMMVTGYEYGELAIYITDKDEMVIYPIWRDEEFEARIYEYVADFLTRVKEAKRALKGLKKQREIEQTVSMLEPEPIPSEVLAQFYSSRHKELEDKIDLVAPEEIAAQAEAYIKAKADEQEAKERAVEAKVAIQKFMRDNYAKRAEWPGGYIGFKSRLIVKQTA